MLKKIQFQISHNFLVKIIKRYIKIHYKKFQNVNF